MQQARNPPRASDGRRIPDQVTRTLPGSAGPLAARGGRPLVKPDDAGLISSLSS